MFSLSVTNASGHASLFPFFLACGILLLFFQASRQMLVQSANVAIGRGFLATSFVIVFLFTACNQDDEVSPTANENTGRVEQLLQTVERKDSVALAGFFVDDVSLTLPLSADGSVNPRAVFTGKPAVLGYFRNIFNNFSQVRFANSRIYGTTDGTTVFAEGQGDFVGTARLNNVPYRNVYVFKFEFRNGQVMRVSEYVSPILASLVFGLPLGPCQRRLCQ